MLKLHACSQMKILTSSDKKEPSLPLKTRITIALLNILVNLLILVQEFVWFLPESDKDLIQFFPFNLSLTGPYNIVGTSLVGSNTEKLRKIQFLKNTNKKNPVSWPGLKNQDFRINYEGMAQMFVKNDGSWSQLENPVWTRLRLTSLIY